LIYSTCLQNLATHFSHSRDTIAGVEIEMRHVPVTLTMSFLGWFVICRLELDVVCLCTKIWRL